MTIADNKLSGGLPKSAFGLDELPAIIAMIMFVAPATVAGWPALKARSNPLIETLPETSGVNANGVDWVHGIDLGLVCRRFIGRFYARPSNSQ